MTLACQAIVPGGGDICRAMCGFGGGMTSWLPRYLPQGDGLAPPGRLRTQWKVGAGAGGGGRGCSLAPHISPVCPSRARGEPSERGRRGEESQGGGVLRREEGREANGDPRKAYVHPRAPEAGRRGCGGHSGRCPCARSGAARPSGGERGRTGCGWNGRCCPWGRPAGAWGLACGAPHREPPASPLPRTQDGIALRLAPAELLAASPG